MPSQVRIIRLALLRHIFPILWLVITSSPTRAQEGGLCPDYEEIDPLQECQTVLSYADLVGLLESTPSGAKLDLCPFFVSKVQVQSAIHVTSGIQVRCVRRTEDDSCVIDGLGQHLWIDTSENTLWQGMSFRNSDDHAVYITGAVDKPQIANHTFCHTSFIQNIRLRDTRGGALMIEASVGTVNVVETLFSENFSTNYGAGIYSRGSELIVIESVFVRNRSDEYGPAIFTASGSSLMIQGSIFLNNRGQGKFGVVFNGGTILLSECNIHEISHL
jgi:predicted outer membrane repeat protein